MRTYRLLTVPQHALGRGCVSPRALPMGLPMGCVPREVSAHGVHPEGVCLGVYVSRGVCVQVGVQGEGCVFPVDRQTYVKILHWYKLRLRAVVKL